MKKEITTEQALSRLKRSIQKLHDYNRATESESSRVTRLLEEIRNELQGLRSDLAVRNLSDGRDPTQFRQPGW